MFPQFQSFLNHHTGAKKSPAFYFTGASCKKNSVEWDEQSTKFRLNELIDPNFKKHRKMVWWR